MAAATFMEWNGTALVPLAILEAGDRPVLRTNLNTNPSGSVDAAGYGRVTGTGGAAVLTREAGAGADGKPGFIRATWTSAATSGGGINVPAAGLMPAAVAVGSQFTIQAMVRLSTARTLAIGGYPRNGASGSSATQVKLAVPANTWTPLAVTLNPSTIAGDNLYAYWYFDGTPNAPGVGDWMDLDLVMAAPGTSAAGYVDGDVPDTVDYVYEWTGAPGASSSVERDARGGILTALIV